MPDETGPFISAAALCQEVLEEKNGTLSAIRLVDRFNVAAEVTQEGRELGVETPAEMPPLELPAVLLLSFKSGDARGTYRLNLAVASPDGAVQPLGPPFPLTFLGEDAGVNVIPRLTLRLKGEGLYWINVSLNDRLITRVPLRVVYQQTDSAPDQTGRIPQ